MAPAFPLVPAFQHGTRIPAEEKHSKTAILCSLCALLFDNAIHHSAYTSFCLSCVVDIILEVSSHDWCHNLYTNVVACNLWHLGSGDDSTAPISMRDGPALRGVRSWLVLYWQLRGFLKSVGQLV